MGDKIKARISTAGKFWRSLTPQVSLLFGNPGLHLIHGSLGAKVHTPNGIPVGWAVVVWLVVMTNRQTERHTDRPRYL